MKMHDFDYVLPTELIAQTPVEPRDASRLLVVKRTDQSWQHRHFHELGRFLQSGDLLIANQSRVLPARLLGRRAETGGTVEMLLLAERPDLGANYWETLVRPGRRLHEGSILEFDAPQVGSKLQAQILQRTEAGGRIVQFQFQFQFQFQSQLSDEQPRQEMTVRQCIEAIGHMPLPPYIHQTLDDPERYQTVYARIQGSAAAPTAGLHFTPQLLDQLRKQGVRIGFVTLHVGLDTFRPVECENIHEHKMHSEEIMLDAPTAELINETRKAGGRVIAVGTTSVRVLESVASMHNGQIVPYAGQTRLFITPGYRFQAVDAMITNFHLPRSTLLLLVSAFMGKDFMQQIYQEAIDQRYRFFSFGDAMLLF